MQTVLGYDPAKEISENAVSHVHPDDAPAMRDALEGVRTGQTATVTVRSQHADGTWRWMEITLSPLLDAERSLVEVYSAARDVTQRVLATQQLANKAAALQRSEAHFRSVFENGPMAMCRLDAAGVADRTGRRRPVGPGPGRR